MNEQEIFDILKGVISDVKPKLDLSGITKKSSLVKDLGIDSLSMLMVSLACEERLKVEFSTGATFNTVQDVIDYVINKQK